MPRLKHLTLDEAVNSLAMPSPGSMAEASLDDALSNAEDYREIGEDEDIDVFLDNMLHND